MLRKYFISQQICNKFDTISFLIYGLVFPQINIIMKPQVLDKVTSYRTKRYGKYSIIASVFDSWNKIQKNL